MKKTITFLILNSISFIAFAQENENSLDILKAPSSVAFNLLGISPSSIDKPTDITSFAFAVQNATGDFTALPKEYAMEFLPFTLFGKESMTTKELSNTKFSNVFKQSLLVSLGIINQLEDEVELDKPKLTKLGLGVKFSICRPGFDKTSTILLDSIYSVQYKILTANEKLSKNNDELNDLLSKQKEIVKNKEISDEDRVLQLKDVQKEILNKKIEIRKEIQSVENQEKEDNDLKVLQELAKKNNFNRQGFFLDFASGIVIDFEDETFNRSQVTKAGAWLTGGYTFEKKWDICGVTRYLFQPDKVLADDSGVILDTENISSLDGGLRIIYRPTINQKLSLSAESIYRSVFNSDLVDPSWRLVCNASYDFGKSKIVTFSFGKDFDNSFIKGKNLIAALNFIIGLGNSIKNDGTK